MSFKDTQSYKELQADWRWIRSMDPEAAAAADQWVKEHPEEWKELEHMLYYNAHIVYGFAQSMWVVLEHDVLDVNALILIFNRS